MVGGGGGGMKVFTNVVILFLQALQSPISQQVWSTHLHFFFESKTNYSVLGIREILQCGFENTELCSIPSYKSA